MIKIAKRARRMLTLLLTASMLVGSVPVNAFAMEGMAAGKDSVLEESLQLEQPLDGVSAQGEVSIQTDMEHVGGALSVSENGGNSTSDNEMNGKIQITFGVQDESFSSCVEVISKTEDVTIEENKTSIVPGTALAFKLKVKEGYKVREVIVGGISTLEPDSEEIYRVTPKVSTSITIVVNALKEYDVTFSYDDELVYGLKVKTGRKDVELKDKVAVNMLEDSIISFTVDLDEQAKIIKVKANGKDVPAKQGLTYELPALNEDVVVDIETSLDDTKCYTLDIHVEGHRDSVSIKCGNKKYGHQDRILTQNKNETITVHLDSNYEVTEIDLNGEKKEFGKGYTETYTVDFSKEKNQVLKIYTSPKLSKEEKKIIFANKSTNISYKVKEYEDDNKEKIIVKKDPLKSNTYTICEAVTLMEFSVTYKEGYRPKITITNTGKDAGKVLYDIETNENKETGERTDTYSLAVATMGNAKAPTEVTIEENPQPQIISVVYDHNRLEKIEAIVDGRFIEASKTDVDETKKLTTAEYIYDFGTEIILQLETKVEFKVGEVRELVEDKVVKTTTLQQSECSYTIKVDNNKKIEIQLEDDYTTRLFDQQGENPYEIEAKESIYSVETERKYKVWLYKGNEKQEVQKAALKNQGKVLNAVVSIKDSEDIYFEIPKNLVGKNLILELECKEKDKTVVLSVQLKVLPTIKITSIAGVKNGKVSQTVDTIKEYKINCNQTIEEGKFDIEIVTAKNLDEVREEQVAELNEKAKANFDAKIVEDKLWITVKTAKENEQARIKIYDTVKSTEGKKVYVAGGDILITSAAPAFVKSKPVVSLKSATNLDVILNLGMKNLAKIESGVYWYKIEGIPQNTDKTAAEVKSNTSNFVEYIKYEDVAQVEKIRVVGRDKTDITEGTFHFKADYKIRVSLIQTSDKNKPDVTESNVAFRTNKAVEIKASTRVPSYETKLGIKNIKTTIYAGQRDVVVATPVFSKTTSYQDIKEVNVKQENSGLTVSVNEINDIVVSASTTTKPGKYNIEVTADAPKDTMPASKEFTIQVVRGIYEITLDTPKELYKEYNKDATLKVGIIYNEGDKEKQPKTPKVEWMIQTIQDDGTALDLDKEHPDYKKLSKIYSIKDGVVTIKKEFIVSAKEWENKFRVKAVAVDYPCKEEDRIVGYSDEIVITNKKITLGELVLVKENSKESNLYDVVARSGHTATVEQINGSKLMLLKKGTPEREQYSKEHFMETLGEDLIYSVNNKAIEINEDYSVSVNAVAKGINFVVKATNGSNEKSELKNLTLTYVTAADLGIVVEKAENGMEILESYASGSTDFYGPKDEIFILRIQEKNEKGIGRSAYGADYKLDVKGAKIFESNRLAGVYGIVGTSESIKISVTNNTSKDVKTFTLKNIALDNNDTKNSKALKLKVEGSLKTGYFKEEQKIIITMPKASVGKYSHAYVTIDRVDYLDKKKTSYYDSFLEASQGSIEKIHTLNGDGKIVLSFGKGGEYYIPEANFTYKLNIAFGTMSDTYEFKAMVKPNAVTIKTKNEKIPNAKILASYNISAKEEGMIKLALNNKKVQLSSVGKLMNKNINGKENAFTSYFVLDKENFTVKLKPGVDISKIGKNDWTGYISEYTYTDGYREKTIYKTLIKINKKDLVQKYSLSTANILTTDEISVSVNLIAGKNVVNAKYVYVPESQNFTAKVDNGQVNLQSKKGIQIKSSNKCTIYVVPEYSYYADIIADAEQDFTEKMMQYGIKLTATINMKNREKATGKIKFDSKALKAKLTVDNFVTVSDNEVLDGVYKIEIPYTIAMDQAPVSISNQVQDSLVKIEKTIAGDSVTLTLNKKDLNKAFETDKKIYGKTLTVKAVAVFGSGMKDEVITFKVTLPKQPIQLTQAKEELDKMIWSDLEIKYKGLDAEQLVSENREIVKQAASSVLSKDGDLKVSITTGKAVVPTKETEGYIEYTIMIEDIHTKEVRNIYPKILLGRLLDEPKDLETELRNAINFIRSYGVTNQTVVSNVISTVRRRVLEQNGLKHLRLYAKELVRVEATEECAGYISGVFCIVNASDSNIQPLEISFKYVIDKLLTLEEAVDAVKQEVEKIVVYNNDLSNVNSTKKIQEIIDVAEKVLIAQDYYVEVKVGSYLEGSLATGDVPGKAYITLEVINLMSERISEEVVCEFKVLAKQE